MSAFADQNHAPSLTCVRLEKILRKWRDSFECQPLSFFVKMSYNGRSQKTILQPDDLLRSLAGRNVKDMKIVFLDDNSIGTDIDLSGFEVKGEKGCPKCYASADAEAEEKVVAVRKSLGI